jgi:arginine/ornithine N-succinyltransferase beta subunit
MPKRNKRYKMAPGTILNLSKLLNIKIRFFKIKMLTLVLKKTPKFKLKALFLELESKGIIFQELISKIKFSFSRVRGKKQRRV